MHTSACIALQMHIKTCPITSAGSSASGAATCTLASCSTVFAGESGVAAAVADRSTPVFALISSLALNCFAQAGFLRTGRPRLDCILQ